MAEGCAEAGIWAFSLNLGGEFGKYPGPIIVGRAEDEERPIKKVVWLYRVGGVVMLLLTLRLVGII